MQIIATINTGLARSGTVTVAGQVVTLMQPGRPFHAVTGRVTETWTSLGMAGATVSFAGSSDSGSTTTDRDGSYTLALASGSYQIQMSRPAFQTATMIVNISADMTLNTNLNENQPFPLPANEVIGYWEGGGLYPDQPMFMTLLRNGEGVSGWYRDRRSVSDGLTGTYSGKTLNFRVPVADGVLVFECTVDDERRIHGLVKNERSSGGNTVIWFIRN